MIYLRYFTFKLLIGWASAVNTEGFPDDCIEPKKRSGRGTKGLGQELRGVRKLGIMSAALVALGTLASADYIIIASSSTGDDFYVEVDSIKKHSGYVYFWEIIDQLIPDDYGNISTEAYIEAVCDGPRKTRRLTNHFYAKPMAEGPRTESFTNPSDWRYVRPGSVSEAVLDFVCSQAGR